MDTLSIKYLLFSDHYAVLNDKQNIAYNKMLFTLCIVI